MPEWMGRGGDGSGVHVGGAPVVLALVEGDDEVRYVEAKMMARGCRRFLSGAVRRSGRRSSGRRLAPVVDGFVVWLHEKFNGVVRGKRNGKGRGMGAASGSGTHWCRRKWKKIAADRRSSGEQICRPGGVLGSRVWGKRRRGRRVSYRWPESGD